VASRGGQHCLGRSILSWLGGVKCVGWRPVGVGWAEQMSESGSASPCFLPSATVPPGVARLARKGAEVIEARGTGDRVAVSGVLDGTGRSRSRPVEVGKGKTGSRGETPSRRQVPLFQFVGGSIDRLPCCHASGRILSLSRSFFFS
jgi:hypothetical protein